MLWTRDVECTRRHAVPWTSTLRRQRDALEARLTVAVEHAAEEMHRLTLARQRSPVLLRGRPRCACRRSPALLPSELLVVDRIHFAQARVLLVRVRNVTCPRTDAALGHTQLGGDDTHREAILAAEPPCFIPFGRLHEHRFAFGPDGENYTLLGYAPMV
jgi:hypothetical protein